MCAAVAAPVSPVKLSRNLILRPVTVAVKVPDPLAPFGAGISWLTVRNAFSFAVVTLRLPGADEAASADAVTITATSATTACVARRIPIFFLLSVLDTPCHSLIRDRHRFGLTALLGRDRAAERAPRVVDAPLPQPRRRPPTYDLARRTTSRRFDVGSGWAAWRATPLTGGDAAGMRLRQIPHPTPRAPN